jgi:hypothetical protein
MRIRHTSRLLLVGAAALVGMAASLLVASPSHAVPGLVVVNAVSPDVGSESFKFANAVCPAGTVILGGGADIIGGGREVRLTSALPSPLGFPTHSYYATASEDGSYAANWRLQTWAICGSGVSGWQLVSNSAAAVAGSTLTSVTATCPAGKRVIGSGAASTGGFRYVLDTVQPSADLTSVYVEVAGDESTPIPGSAWGAHAYAVCINPVAGQQRVSASSAFNSSDKFINVTCPAGTRVHGGAASLTGLIGQGYIDRIGITGSGADLDAREDQTGFTGSWSATVYAICAV